MSIIEMLEKLPKGAVIDDKRILAVLKRNGIINDYSPWGYLERHYVYYKDNWDGKETIEREMCYSGKDIAEGAIGSITNPFPSRKALWDAGYDSSISAEYKGVKLGSKYLDGCFNAYLYKVGGTCTTDKEVHPRMSLWGAIV